MLSKGLRRAVKHFWQRRMRGFDDSVTWNLDHEFAKWIVPRLTVYKQKASEFGIVNELYAQVLDEMIEGFALKPLQFEDDDDFEDAQERIRIAGANFAEYWECLWW